LASSEHPSLPLPGEGLRAAFITISGSTYHRHNWALVGCDIEPLTPGLFKTKCPPRVKRVISTMRRPLPIYPDKQTFSASVGTSQRRHRTNPLSREGAGRAVGRIAVSAVTI